MDRISLMLQVHCTRHSPSDLLVRHPHLDRYKVWRDSSQFRFTGAPVFQSAMPLARANPRRYYSQPFAQARQSRHSTNEDHIGKEERLNVLIGAFDRLYN